MTPTELTALNTRRIERIREIQAAWHDIGVKFIEANKKYKVGDKVVLDTKKVKGKDVGIELVVKEIRVDYTHDLPTLAYYLFKGDNFSRILYHEF